ncbi:DUF7482 domain-containing protein [Undibacterium sp. TJN25]|uniref:DUF7482 domain-containing protein n=1 Tax=Undibacterium sp. TJN25 TaxID=3413056 RepID=UPI003BEF950A
MRRQNQYHNIFAANILLSASIFTCGAVYAQAPAAPAPALKLDENTVATIELPLLAGWYQGNLVHYISTDMSDRDMAQQTATNYVPRLKHALRAPVPGQPSAVDRVYKFPNFNQGSVFPSAPQPAGYASTSAEYTPLWVVYMVSWLPGTKPRVLRSEEEVLDAEEKKLVSIQATDIVVNCPILFAVKDGKLQEFTIHIQKP